MAKIIERQIKGEVYPIAMTSMMTPCNEREIGKVFMMCQLLAQQDIHFFEKIGNRWILIPNYSFIKLDGHPKLIDLYQAMPRNVNIEFDAFILMICCALHGDRR